MRAVQLGTMYSSITLIHSSALSFRLGSTKCSVGAMSQAPMVPETTTPRVVFVCDAVSRSGVSSSLSASIFEATGKPVALTSAWQSTPALLKPTNLWENVWKELFMRVMKIILRWEESTHWTITILWTNSSLCLKQWKFQMQRQQWIKNGKIGENTSMAADGSQKLKWGDRWSKDWGLYFSFCVVNGSLSSQKFGVGTSISEIQRQGRTPRWHCERWFRIICSIYWTSIISITDDSCKSHGHYFKTSGMRKTSSRRNFCLRPGQNGRCTIIVKNSEVRMSRYLDTSTTTQMAKIMVQYGRPSRSSWAKFVRSSFGRTVKGKAIWENPIEVRLEEGFQLGMLIRTPWKRFVLICVCGWHQINSLERNKIWILCGKYSWKKLIWESRHHCLTTSIWVALRENVKQAKIL